MAQEKLIKNNGNMPIAKDFILKPEIINESLKKQIIDAIAISPHVRMDVKKILSFL